MFCLKCAEICVKHYRIGCVVQNKFTLCSNKSQLFCAAKKSSKTARVNHADVLQSDMTGDETGDGGVGGEKAG